MKTEMKEVTSAVPVFIAKKKYSCGSSAGSVGITCLNSSMKSDSETERYVPHCAP
jgi:hypothetical protein